MPVFVHSAAALCYNEFNDQPFKVSNLLQGAIKIKNKVFISYVIHSKTNKHQNESKATKEVLWNLLAIRKLFFCIFKCRLRMILTVPCDFVFLLWAFSHGTGAQRLFIWCHFYWWSECPALRVCPELGGKYNRGWDSLLQYDYLY